MPQFLQESIQRHLATRVKIYQKVAVSETRQQKNPVQKKLITYLGCNRTPLHVNGWSHDHGVFRSSCAIGNGRLDLDG